MRYHDMAVNLVRHILDSDESGDPELDELSAKLRKLDDKKDQDRAKAAARKFLSQQESDVDPNELKKGSKDEQEEHDMPPRKAKKTALQHLLRVDPKYYTKVDKCLEEGCDERQNRS